MSITDLFLSATNPAIPAVMSAVNPTSSTTGAAVRNPTPINIPTTETMDPSQVTDSMLRSRYQDISRMLSGGQQDAADILRQYGGQAASQLSPFAQFGVGAGEQLAEALGQGYERFNPDIGPTEELAGYQDMLAGRDEALGEAATRFAGLGKMFSGSAMDEFANIGGRERMALRESALNRAAQDYQLNQAARNQWMGQLGQMLAGGQQAAGGMSNIYGNLGSQLAGNITSGNLARANLSGQNIGQMLQLQQMRNQQKAAQDAAQRAERMERTEQQRYDTARADQAEMAEQDMWADILGGIGMVGGGLLGLPGGPAGVTAGAGIGSALGQGLGSLFG